MEKDMSKGLSFTVLVKELMDTYTGAGDIEWLFLCQNQECFEAAGSELGLMFMNDMSIHDVFPGFVDQKTKSNCETSPVFDGNSTYNLLRSAQNYSFKRQTLDLPVSLKNKEENKTSLSIRRKLTTNVSDINLFQAHGDDYETVDNKVLIEDTDHVIQEMPEEEQTLVIETEVNTKKDSNKNEVMGGNLDHMADDFIVKSLDLVDEADSNLLDKSERLKQHSMEEGSEIRSKQNEEDGSVMDSSFNETSEAISVIRERNYKVLCELCGRALEMPLSTDSQTEMCREKKIKCKLCQAAFTSRKIRKQLDKAEKPQLYCKICLQPFVRKQSIIKHIKTHISDENDHTENDIDQFILNEIDKNNMVKSPSISSNERAQQKTTLTLKYDLVKSGESKNPLLPCKYLKRFDVDDIEITAAELTADIKMGETTCSICFKEFLSSAALRGHQHMHTKSETDTIQKVQSSHKCNKCGSTFLTELQLQNHLSRKKTCGNSEVLLREKLPVEEVTYTDKSTGEKIKTTLLDLLRTIKLESGGYICVVCQHRFQKFSNLQNHILVCHSKVKPHTCKFCNKLFKTEHNMNLHKVAMHKSLLKMVSCDFCGAECLTEEKLEWHKIYKCSRQINQTFKCDACDYTTNNRSKFEDHLRSHMTKTGKRFDCKICNKTLASNKSLTAHMLALHSEKTSFKCTICEAVFKTRVLARQHHLAVHEKPKYHCEICNKSFRRLNYFKVHAQYHTNKKPWVCEVCGKSFRQKFCFVRHQTLHSNKKPYKCSICDAKFHLSLSLKQHEAIHEANNHICDVCGKTFKLLSRLNDHRKHHSADYSRDHYTCKLCNINCETVTKYKTHFIRCHPDTLSEMESTTSLRFHKCSLCPKQFSYSCGLKKHMKAHAQKPLSCPECYRLFSSDVFLQRHIKNQHRPKMSVSLSEVAKTLDKHGSVIKTKSLASSEKKTKSAKKRTSQKRKAKSKIQSVSRTMPAKPQKNDKEYTAVKASDQGKPINLSYMQSAVLFNQTEPHINNFIAPHVRTNDLGTAGVYPHILNMGQTSSFFSNL